MSIKYDGGLEYILSPKSIAIIGASSRMGSVGQSIFSNIILNNFKGNLYPINPKVSAISGIKTYSSIIDVPDNVDLAIIIIPSKEVISALEDCGKKGVKGVVVISAGFK